MQTNTMKTIRLFFLLFLLPLTFHAQKTLTGLWTGSMSNDSTSARKDQSFEIALTQYKQKVYGYSRSTFIVNDTLYYILKRVKGTINGDVCEIEDDEIVSYNFRGKIDKGVKVTTTFRMNKQDSAWYLAGNWNTNKTKRYYSVSGKVDLKDEPDMTKSKIVPHLEELNLAGDIPFYAEAKKAEADEERRRIAANSQKDPVVKSTAAINNKTTPEKTQTVAANKNTGQTNKSSTIISEAPKSEPVAVLNKPTEKKEPVQETSLAKTESKNPSPVNNVTRIETPDNQEETLVNKPNSQKQSPSSANLLAEQKKQQQAAANISKEEKKPEQIAVKKQEQSVAQEPVAVVAESRKQEVSTVLTTQETKKPVTITIENKPAITISAAALVRERKMAAPQEVFFKGDSLQVSLYDNGEIDGDTVSVLLNGEIILAKQGLKATAIKRTIYTQPGDNEFNMVLYAENLGKYPPNTGLLVVYDGEERYQVRFSADLQQNATIIFRRKK
jgi:hypothetical protein